jgi:hypothetical protein
MLLCSICFTTTKAFSVDTTIFYPMSERPSADESDESFSKTVIIYGEGKGVIELGYFDFEQGQWSHFGTTGFLLKCWCYIPEPGISKENKDWQAVAPKGYNSLFTIQPDL